MQILTFLTGLLMGVEYFCFAISLPQNDEEHTMITGLFTFMGILQLIVALLLCCAFNLQLRRIGIINEYYGRLQQSLAVFLLVAATFSSIINFYFSSDDAYSNFLKMREEQTFIWILLWLPYFFLTEFMPALAFAVVHEKIFKKMD